MPTLPLFGSMTKVLESKFSPLVIATVVVAVEVRFQSPERMLRVSASAFPMLVVPFDQKLFATERRVVEAFTRVVSPVALRVPVRVKLLNVGLDVVRTF